MKHPLLEVVETSGKIASLQLIVDGLGQDQQQYPAVHTGGVSRGRVLGFGCWRK